MLGCPSPESPGPPSAQAVIDSAVAAHGGAVLDRAVVTFTFRGDRYRLRQDNGRFLYRRSYTDSLGRRVHDGLTNEGPYRIIEGDTIALSDAEQSALHTTVNSVAYFTLLPSPLQDAAVQPTYEARDTLNGTAYHRLRVTFRREGGGQDWEDVFLYWFSVNTYEMDYLAYAYGLGTGDTDPGTRFRAAYNERRVHGVRFADYRNYTAPGLAPDQLRRYPARLAADALTLVSRVKIDSIEVRLLAADE
ncbi:MAG: hypothetical protein BRD55_10850 [Bacteroidetes bacterium SW_9_63_38]|nr:MAG: hypothetical protein BRD55_10850 [Bacteroidetes bacterium SW_9_63_38]